jgi:hypothetical protein
MNVLLEAHFVVICEVSGICSINTCSEQVIHFWGGGGWELEAHNSVFFCVVNVFFYKDYYTLNGQNHIFRI